MQDFKTKSIAFFKDENGNWRKGNITAVLIGGFVGWLVLTMTIGGKLKSTLTRLPLIGGLLKKRRAKRSSPRRNSKRY